MGTNAAVEELSQAITSGDATTVRRLLAADPSLATIPSSGPSPLLLAIYHGQRDLLPVILPHARRDLHEAAAMGDANRIRAIVSENRAAVNTKSEDGWTPLHLAAFFADARTVDVLLQHGADPHARSANSIDNTPLHAAIAGRGDAEVVRRLVDAGSDVNAVGEGGWTPLHLAGSRGDVALIGHLLARGADPKAAGVDGRDAARMADERGHADAAARLRAALGQPA